MAVEPLGATPGDDTDGGGGGVPAGEMPLDALGGRREKGLGSAEVAADIVGGVGGASEAMAVEQTGAPPGDDTDGGGGGGPSGEVRVEGMTLDEPKKKLTKQEKKAAKAKAAAKAAKREEMRLDGVDGGEGGAERVDAFGMQHVGEEPAEGRGLPAGAKEPKAERAAKAAKAAEGGGSQAKLQAPELKTSTKAPKQKN